MRRKLDLRTGRPVWFAYRAPASRANADPRRQGGCRDRRHGHQRRDDGRGAGRARPFGHLHRPARPDEGLDGRDDGAGAVRDRPAADRAVAMIGTEQGRARLAALAAGVSNLSARIAELGIDCGAGDTPSLYLAGNVLGPRRSARGGRARGKPAGSACDLPAAAALWRSASASTATARSSATAI